MKALSIILFGQAIFEIAVTCVKCSVEVSPKQERSTWCLLFVNTSSHGNLHTAPLH